MSSRHSRARRPPTCRACISVGHSAQGTELCRTRVGSAGGAVQQVAAGVYTRLPACARLTPDQKVACSPRFRTIPWVRCWRGEYCGDFPPELKGTRNTPAKWSGHWPSGVVRHFWQAVVWRSMQAVWVRFPAPPCIERHKLVTPTWARPLADALRGVRRRARPLVWEAANRGFSHRPTRARCCSAAAGARRACSPSTIGAAVSGDRRRALPYAAAGVSLRRPSPTPIRCV